MNAGSASLTVLWSPLFFSSLEKYGEKKMRSGRTAADAREARRLAEDFSNDQRRQGFGPRRPGGIDWTSLELHYVSDNPQTKDFGYAFSAAELPDDGEAEPGYGGEAALDLSSDALFTWLSLDQSQFWVNLNPDTPESMIDPQFATTDAGRVLLQADLRFKETQNTYMDPATERGKAFWDSMERTSDGLICHGSYWMWVEPKPATVREDGDQLYILDAPLAARYEPMDIDWRPPGQGEDLCEGAPQDVVDRNTQRIADTFAPLLEQRVNTAPEYADLRRVYTSRVAAQWLKDRDAERPGAFHDVIGSGDVSAWPTRTAWDPQDVFDEYLEQLSTPLFRYEWTFGEMDYWMDIVGGVTFPDTPREAMPAEQFQQEHPTLPATVQSSLYDAVSVPVAAPAGDAVGTFAEGAESISWLGGGPIVQIAPEPTDPPDPGPVDPPAPGARRPAGFRRRRTGSRRPRRSVGRLRQQHGRPAHRHAPRGREAARDGLLRALDRPDRARPDPGRWGARRAAAPGAHLSLRQDDAGQDAPGHRRVRPGRVPKDPRAPRRRPPGHTRSRGYRRRRPNPPPDPADIAKS